MERRDSRSRETRQVPRTVYYNKMDINITDAKEEPCIRKMENKNTDLRSIFFFHGKIERNGPR